MISEAHLQGLGVVDTAPGVGQYVRVLGQAVLEAPDRVRHPAIPRGVHEATAHQARVLHMLPHHSPF